MTDKLDALKSAHAELMVEYADLINQVSKLSFLVIINVFPPKEVLLRFVTTPRKDEFFEIFGKLSYYINCILSYTFALLTFIYSSALLHNTQEMVAI